MLHRIYVVLCVGLILASCAKGSSLPNVPGLENQRPQVTGTKASGNTHHLWGYWTVVIDSQKMEATAIPLRNVEFTCNVTQFMQPPASPVNMLSIEILPGSVPANGYFEVDVTLRHPFPGLPFYRGFDVRGIFISNGSIVTDLDPTATYASETDARLLNADGLTRWWNPTEFTTYGTIFGFTHGKLAPKVLPTATLNGYKYFADALGYNMAVWEMDPSSRGTYPTKPGVYKRPYFIQFPLNGGQPQIVFNYAVDASWFPPDPSGLPDYPLESFPIEANMAEAYCISVLDNGSTAYYENSGSKGGVLKLAIKVYDWQGAVESTGVPGEISGIWLESPVIPTPINVLPQASVSPDGPTSSVFEVELDNLTLTQSGNMPLLVFVEASDDFGYEPQVANSDKFNYPPAPLGAYLLTSVHILSENPSSAAPIVLSINPNSAKSGDKLSNVVVGGLNFQNGAQVELRHPDWQPIKATSEVTQSGGTVIICNLDLNLAAEGDWDVAVINPDLQEGVLKKGFHVNCADGLHSYEGKYFITGALSWNYCQRGDLTVLETGPYAGQCVVKRNYSTTGDCPGYYVRFDPDNPADAQGYDFFSVPGRNDNQTNYITMTASIDQNPVNGHIAVINGRMFNVIQIVDQNGNPVENITITDPATVSGQIPVCKGVDFDDDGDLWLITNVKGIPDETGNPIWQMRHYELQSSSPYYVEKMADRLDVTEDLFDPSAQPYGYMWYIADIAISYTDNSLFVFAVSILGWGQSLFVKYDLTTSPPTKVMTKDLLPKIVYCSNPHGVSRADIEFDHSDLSVENCRLMVMYQTYDGSVRTNLMRLDTDLNILEDEIVGPGFGAWDNPHAIAFNTDPVKRNIVGIDMDNVAPQNDFYYFSMPATGW